MKKIIRLTESDLARIVRRVINEQSELNDLMKPKDIQTIQNLMKPAQYRIEADGKYQVRPGDTLSKIASEYNTTIEKLMELNPGIENQDRIYVGDFINYK